MKLNNDAELIVVDYLLRGNDPDPVKILHPLCFEDTENKAVFSSLKTLIDQKTPIDFITASAAIKDLSLTKYDGSFYPSMNISFYVNTLLEVGARKHLQRTLREAIEQLNKDDATTARVRDSVLASMNTIHQGINPDDIYDSGRMIEAYEEHIKNLRRNMVHIGVDAVDREIRGIAGGEVLTIIARAGSYKTALLQNILRTHTKTSGTGAVFFSLEMPVASLTERYISIIKGWPGLDVYISFREYDAETATANAKQAIREDLKNLFIVTKRISLSDIPSYVNHIQNTRNIDISLIGIDYLGLLNEQGKSEYEIVSKIAKDTKDVAKQLNIPVIVLSQVSRKGGEGEKEITLDMGRGSGAIEEAADFLFGLWQEKDEEGEMSALVLKILKNRKGRAGTAWRLNIDVKNFRLSDTAEKINKEAKLTIGIVSRTIKRDEY